MRPNTSMHSGFLNSLFMYLKINSRSSDLTEIQTVALHVARTLVFTKDSIMSACGKSVSKRFSSSSVIR